MTIAQPKRQALAIEGGRPTRRIPLPYARQSLDETDIAAVNEVLRSDWLTTGPKIEEFENTFAQAVGALEAVAVSSGTAALHAAMSAVRIGPGEEVIVPAMTFAASANCAVFQGGTPVFADVDPETLLLDPADVERKITSRTRAVIAVDYAGQPCDYPALRSLANRHGLLIIDDAAHALGARLEGRPVGSLADLNTFSFHPVKHITTGEGGMVTCDDAALATSLRAFRNHGITHGSRGRAEPGNHYYAMTQLGYNYRLTDFQCALGLSQLRRLGDFVARRQAIAARYNDALGRMGAIKPLHVRPKVSHAYHLYVIQLDLSRLTACRDEICRALWAEGIRVNVHYIPVHLHPFYRERFGTGPGICPVAEAAYEKILTLPLFPGMTDEDVSDVIVAMLKVLEHYEPGQG